jgi:hypothetical protein
MHQKFNYAYNQNLVLTKLNEILKHLIYNNLI